MQQIKVKLNTLPIDLILLSNGTVAFITQYDFKSIAETGGEEVNAFIDTKGLTVYSKDGIESEEFSLRIAYRLADFPLLRKWLKAQQLDDNGFFNKN